MFEYVEKNLDDFQKVFFHNRRFLFLLLSRFYPLSNDFIIRYSDKLDLEILGKNKNIDFSQDLLDKLEYISPLSKSENIPWSEFILSNCDWGWEDWFEFSSNHSLPWSESFIFRFKDKWDWERLSSNPSLPWSQGFIDSFIEKWDWKKLSRNPGFVEYCIE